MRFLSLSILWLALVGAGMPTASAGEWPSGDREAFVRDCLAGAKARYQEAPAHHYCECSADRVAAEFSSAELRQMRGTGGQLAVPVQDRLLGATSHCLSQLNPP